MPNVKWYGAEFAKHVDSLERQRLRKAGETVKKQAKALISKAARSIKGQSVMKSGYTRTTYGAKGSERSAPNEPPRKDTGDLFRSVKSKLTKRGLTVRVSAAAALMEHGSKKMKPRPFLGKALKQCESEVKSILTAPIEDFRVK